MNYPEAEHYEFPHTPTEQLLDELRLYDDPQSMRRNLIGLRAMYSKTPFAQSMWRYAKHAAVVKNSAAGLPAPPNQMNFDFYSGAMMATHISAAPLPPAVRYQLLQSDVGGLDSDITEEDIRAWLADWIDGIEDGDLMDWHDYMSEQNVTFQRGATDMAERMFAGRSNNYERELDFMAGFAFTSMNIESITGRGTGGSVDED